MKISTKGRYGLRALLDLAIHVEQNEVVTVLSISQRQDISKNYLEQVFSALRKADIVNGVKGPQGGYTLNDDPKNLTIGSILRVLEGSLFDIGDTQEEGNIIQQCINKKVWMELNESINKVVDSITLYDLIEEYKKMHSDYLMFYI
ncbi:BadM/Rrf2 family transcriptional regulator [Natranaerovirga pectinivora]|uniref:BadM/Rrf2 family transcriptional regulator n=1 Tax=Natranaerovirga pectinivora TaxID=682400 RepID=A0A4R3MMI3_9FIRM|nr:Rrf2 family transcriptional regulator [Natranaerovirga pectinivora]TCT15465.1 BadM/Rrf2 family transcriptional regulator [Natranaerovirga pectinivora]